MLQTSLVLYNQYFMNICLRSDVEKFKLHTHGQVCGHIAICFKKKPAIPVT
jgi:hypothetical protein